MRNMLFQIMAVCVFVACPVCAHAQEEALPLLGRQLSDYASTPRFGGYFIGKYSYSDQDGKHSGDGFSQRFARVYVDGTILTDFKYRMQLQISNGSFH
ncbi:MAG: hypothetical protein IJQ38_05750, partial [Bacteroidaceae bacterium]|nr:hypothetical protein [Bacteroidaceae bacterium]